MGYGHLDFDILRVEWVEGDSKPTLLEVEFYYVPENFKEYIFSDVVDCFLEFTFEGVDEGSENSLVQKLYGLIEAPIRKMVFQPFIELVKGKFNPTEVEVLPISSVEGLGTTDLTLTTPKERSDFGGEIPRESNKMIIQQNIHYRYYRLPRSPQPLVVAFYPRPGYIYRVPVPSSIEKEQKLLSDYVALRKEIREYLKGVGDKIQSETLPSLLSKLSEKYKMTRVKVNLPWDINPLTWVSPIMYDTHPVKTPKYSCSFEVDPELWKRSAKHQLLSKEDDLIGLSSYLLFILNFITPIDAAIDSYKRPVDKVLPVLTRFLTRLWSGRKVTEGGKNGKR